MRILTVIAGACSFLSLAGCTGETSTPSGRVASALREVGTAPLRRDAETMVGRVTTRETDGPTKIPENLWSDSIRKFRPEYVYWGSDSVTIVTSRSGRYENGIVVFFPSHPDDSLAPGDSAGGGSGRGDYKIDAGVYWFWQKIRSKTTLRRKLQEMETPTNGSPSKASAGNGAAASQFHPAALRPAVPEMRR